MEGFQAWDRHNPLPHIALSTTALKSAYKNTAFLSTRTSAELRELLIRAAGNDSLNGCPAASLAVAGLREVCYRAKGSCVSRLDDRRIASAAVCVTSCKRAVFLPRDRRVGDAGSSVAVCVWVPGLTSGS
jgi:hypothetical protein